MTQTIEDLDLVAHTCLFPDSAEHIREVTAAWLASGLAVGDRVMYFEDQPSGPVLERLAEDRVPFESALDDGQMVIVPTEETEAAAATPMDEVEGMFRGLVQETTDAGWPGLRINAESAFRTLEIGGMEAVVRYESILDRILAEHPTVRMLCRFDREVFDADALAAVRANHRSELVRSAVYDDAVLRVTSSGTGRIRFAGEVDHSNSALVHRLLTRALEGVLRSADAPDDITADFSSLRFLDVGGATRLVHLAEEFPSRYRLVLTGVRPRLSRVLERCGAGFASQLVVEPRPETGGSRS